MKNHFFFGYAGNKRTEVELIYENIKDKLNDIEYIVEPFCGTSAISFYISSLHPKKFKYILNDNNEHLIKLYNIAKDEEQLKKLEEEINKIAKTINKEIYVTLHKQNSFIGFIITNLIHSMRPGLYDLDYKYKPINLNDKPIINFLRTENIETRTMDGLILIKENINNDKYLFLIDPPYLSACNDFYKSKYTNIYEFFSNNDMKLMKSRIVFILEDNWIIKIIFKNYNIISYPKKYETSKKITTHIIINNF